MSANYDQTLPTRLSQARFLFRDVGGLIAGVVTIPLLQDEEYLGAMATWGENEGLAKCAESLAASFAQKVRHFSQGGGISVDWPDRSTFYLDLAKSIRLNGIGTLVVLVSPLRLPYFVPTLLPDGSIAPADDRLALL